MPFTTFCSCIRFPSGGMAVAYRGSASGRTYFLEKKLAKARESLYIRRTSLQVGRFPSGQRFESFSTHHFSFYGAFFQRARFLLFHHPHDTGKGKRKRGSPSRMHKVFFSAGCRRRDGFVNDLFSLSTRHAGHVRYPPLPFFPSCRFCYVDHASHSGNIRRFICPGEDSF